MVGHHFLLGQISGLIEVGQGLVSDVGSHPVASDGSLGRHGEGWWSMIKRKVFGLIVSRGLSFRLRWRLMKGTNDIYSDTVSYLSRRGALSNLVIYGFTRVKPEDSTEHSSL